MEFGINISFLFKDTFNKIDGRLHPCRHSENSFQIMRQQLFQVIDKMGQASAKAQGLAGAITTGRKLELSDHHLYVMTDPEGTKGNGAVVGILKVGHKRLFVYDRQGQQWEMTPLCVLDFYVHESRQRKGCGRRLFDFMLKSENVVPQHLAIDRPSVKFLSFLCKHYGLSHEIPQMNNFVIFEGFFLNRTDIDYQKFHRHGYTLRPADYNVRNGTKMEQRWPDCNNRVENFHRSHTGFTPNTSRPPSGHVIRTISSGSVRPTHQNMEISHKDLPGLPRPSPPAVQAPNLLRTPQDGLNDPAFGSSSAGNNSSHNTSLQAAMYSRHQMNAASEQLPSAQSHQKIVDAVQRQPCENENDCPANTSSERTGDPCFKPQQRDGAPRDRFMPFYKQQVYQGRDGHLIMPPDPRVGGAHAAIKPASGEVTATSGGKVQTPAAYAGSFYTSPALSGFSNTSWTVMGVLRNQQLQSVRQYGHSRLW